MIFPLSTGPLYFYPRPPRGGRLWLEIIFPISLTISIHALREEGDFLHTWTDQPHSGFLSTPSARRATEVWEGYTKKIVISIHALREEGDIDFDKIDRTVDLFLSTPSARRATSGLENQRRWRFYFYPRPPRGGRLLFTGHRPHRLSISIHALREEGDGSFVPKTRFNEVFLSTPSARRATQEISSEILCAVYFYPRPPRGGRRGGSVHTNTCIHISIHALREEGDLDLAFISIPHFLFLSTPSARRATCAKRVPIPGKKFLSTPSARRATPW